MSDLSLRQGFVIFSVIFIYGSVLTMIYLNFPKMTEAEKQDFKYPRSLEDAKRLANVLSTYKNEHYYTVLAGVITVYIILQSFAIPGSIFLTILSGYLFPFYTAFILVCGCSAVGASVCYLLSHRIGRQIVLKYFGERVAKWQAEVDKQRDDMFYYIVFLRVTPILPNWFINISSPIINIPLKAFFFGTIAGVAPPSILYITAGVSLHSMTDTKSALSTPAILALFAVAFLALVPVVLKRYFAAKSSKNLSEMDTLLNKKTSRYNAKEKSLKSGLKKFD